MMTQAYSVFDRAVRAYLPPFFARSRGEAIRSFSDAVNDAKHQFHVHAADYSLWQVAVFDDASGVCESMEPERVITAVEALVPEDPFPADRQVT